MAANKEIPPFKAGDAVSASRLEQLSEDISKQANIQASAPLVLHKSSAGTQLSVIDDRQPFWAKLGGTSPYSWTQQKAVGGDSTRTGTGAREVNGVGGLAGKIVTLFPEAKNDYRFHWQRTKDTTDPVNTPCCTGLVPTTLYLSDGLGQVTLIYNGPRPISLGTASDMWWGCATRTVTGGRAKAPSGDCTTTPISFDTEIIFGMWCKGPAEGFRLYIFHDGCGFYDDGINVQTHQRKSLGCTTPWVGQYNQIVGGTINGIAAADCSPVFTWGPRTQNFPALPYPYHPLREVYGSSATWMITA